MTQNRCASESIVFYLVLRLHVDLGGTAERHIGSMQAIPSMKLRHRVRTWRYRVLVVEVRGKLSTPRCVARGAQITERLLNDQSYSSVDMENLSN